MGCVDVMANNLFLIRGQVRATEYNNRVVKCISPDNNANRVDFFEKERALRKLKDENLKLENTKWRREIIALLNMPIELAGKLLSAAPQQLLLLALGLHAVWPVLKRFGRKTAVNLLVWRWKYVRAYMPTFPVRIKIILLNAVHFLYSLMSKLDYGTGGGASGVPSSDGNSAPTAVSDSVSTSSDERVRDPNCAPSHPLTRVMGDAWIDGHAAVGTSDDLLNDATLSAADDPSPLSSDHELPAIMSSKTALTIVPRFESRRQPVVRVLDEPVYCYCNAGCWVQTSRCYDGVPYCEECAEGNCLCNRIWWDVVHTQRCCSSEGNGPYGPALRGNASGINSSELVVS